MTGHLLYTEEDVERGVRVLWDEVASGAGFEQQARRFLDALSSANRLVPPGSEVRTARCVHESWSCDHCHDDPPPSHTCPQCGATKEQA